MTVASLDGRRLVVAMLRRAVDRTSSSFGSKGARRPESAAVTLIGRKVRPARFSILQVVEDERGANQSSENKTGNASSDDYVDRH